MYGPQVCRSYHIVWLQPCAEQPLEFQEEPEKETVSSDLFERNYKYLRDLQQTPRLARRLLWDGEKRVRISRLDVFCIVAGAEPVDNDNRLISDDPCVMPGRKEGHVARTKLELGSVRHFHMQPARHVVLEVGSLAPFRLGDRLDIVRPFPSFL